MISEFNLTCPLPLQNYPHILLAHGGGGKLMQQLIEQVFLSAFGTGNQPQHDAATLQLSRDRIAFTTDSYVVQPLIFPGGNIGTLAINGTVNDLAMAGAKPLYLSVGFILEEGLSMNTLWQIVQSMQQAAQKAGVSIVTGDTKVVDKGKGDGIFINTTGIGIVEHDRQIHPRAIQPGDVAIASGDLGRHGIAIMATRAGIEFETTIESDCAPLHEIIAELLAAGLNLHCLRDLTRGGLASALNELAIASQLGIHLDETQIPLREDVKGACELLGFDPLYVANEGRFVAILPESEAETALAILHRYPDLGDRAAIIGRVTENNGGLVTMRNKIGSTRIVELLSGQQLPRIC